MPEQQGINIDYEKCKKSQWKNGFIVLPCARELDVAQIMRGRSYFPFLLRRCIVQCDGGSPLSASLGGALD